MSRVRATSRTLVVLGDPVAHSLSPVMHNAAIAALGLDAVYVALPATRDAVPAILETFLSLDIAGNLTVPLKIIGAHAIHDLTPGAQALGAVNTFWPQDGRLAGDNTDVRGLLDAIEAVDAEPPWLLAGTGGAARAAAVAAVERGAAVLVQSRDPARAATFVEWARTLGVDAREDDGTRAETAINATPLGLLPEDELPFIAERLDGTHAVVDCVYAPGETAWVRACRARGMRATDGRTMLVGQGALAFERFFPGIDAPREVMRAAVDRALRS